MDLPFALSSSQAVRTQTARDPLRAQAEELEGVFLNTLVAEMFKGIETEGMFGGGHAEETWRGMLSEQYAAEMARSGGVGLADHLVANLVELQGAISPDSTPRTTLMTTAIGAYRR